MDAQDNHHLGTVSFIMPIFGSKHMHCEQNIKCAGYSSSDESLDNSSFDIYRFTHSGILVFILGFHWVPLRSILPY